MSCATPPVVIVCERCKKEIVPDWDARAWVHEYAEALACSRQ